MPVIFTFFILFLTGCSLFGGSIERMTLDQSARLIFKASKGIHSASDYDLVKDAFAANLVNLDALYAEASDNPQLLSSLIMAHSAYSFAILETELFKLSLRKVFLEKKRKNHLAELKVLEKRLQDYRRKVGFHYAKAIFYADEFLKRKDSSHQKLFALNNDSSGLKEHLKSRFDLFNDGPESLALLYFAFSLSGTANIARDKMSWVAQLPLAKNLFDALCEIDPYRERGLCLIFYGAYYGARPVDLGGQPALAREYFEKHFSHFPNDTLARLSLMSFILLPLGKKEEFFAQKKIVEKKISSFEERLEWRPFAPQDFNQAIVDQGNFFTAIVKERMVALNKYESALF